MSGGERDSLAKVVLEDDLVFLGSFAPGARDDTAVLENVGFAGTESGDLFVIIIGHGAFLDHHGDDGTGSDLDGVAAVGGGVGHIEIARTTIGDMSFAGLVGAEIAVGGKIVGVAGVVVEILAEIDADAVGGGSGGFALGVIETLIEFGSGSSGGVGRETGESGRAGASIAFAGVEFEELGWGGEKVIPEPARALFAPHVGVILIEVTLAPEIDGGESFVGAAGMDDSTIKGCVPVEIIRAKRTDRADDAGVGVLENGGKASDTGLGDGFEDYAGFGESGLGSSAISAAVRNLDTKSRGGVLSGVGNF